MHDINLLRPLIEQEQEIAKSRGRSGFYITFTIILLIIITSVIFGARLLLLSQSKSLDSRISSLERDLSDVKSMEDKINNFNNTISKLKSLDKTKLSWSQVYDNIAKSTPADVELNQVALVSTAATSSAAASSSSTSKTSSSSTTATSQKLKITGIAKSRRSIALFQYKLQKVGGNFVSVDIISSKKTETQTTTTETGTTQGTEEKIDFEINITLKST